MAPRSSTTRRWRESAAVPYLVLLTSLVVTGSVTTLFSTVTNARDRVRFNSLSRETKDRVRSLMDTHITLLMGGSGLFAGQPDTSRTTFSRFANRVLADSDLPGTLGIGFAAWVPRTEVSTLTNRLHREGSSGFRVWPPTSGDHCSSILYLEPLNRRNLAAIGYDMFSEPIRRAAMERARDTGRAAASARVTLVQEIDGQKQAGFLIYDPVYRGGDIPDNIEDRRRLLMGWVYSPFRAGDLLSTIAPAQTDPNVSFCVWDGESVAADELLYGPSAPTARRPRYHVRDTLKIAGRPWTISIDSTPAFEHASSQREVPFVFLGGLTVSVLLFLLSLMQARARLAAETAANEIRASEENARAAEVRFRSLLEQSPLSTIVVAPDGCAQYVNTAWRRLWGYGDGEIEGMNLFADEALDRSAMLPAVQAATQGHGGQTGPEQFLLPSGARAGEPFWIASWIYPVKDGSGVVREIVIVHEDITERVRAEKLIADHRQRIENLNDRLQRAMTETHHRVKNNLQKVAAMIDLQLVTDSPTVSREEVRRLAGHVRVLATVHDVLTESSKVDAQAQFISARQMLEKLLPLLKSVTQADVRFSLEEARVTGQQGSALALVVNELVSNAAKHGASVVALSLSLREDSVVVTVEDDGPGFPEGFDATTSAHTGLELVERLSRWDLGGDTLYENTERGASVTILFPATVAVTS